MSADLKEGMEAVTVNGQTVKISLAGGAKVNGAKVKKVGEEGPRRGTDGICGAGGGEV